MGKQGTQSTDLLGQVSVDCLTHGYVAQERAQGCCMNKKNLQVGECVQQQRHDSRSPAGVSYKGGGGTLQPEQVHPGKVGLSS